jgi:hypothetical protein
MKSVINLYLRYYRSSGKKIHTFSILILIKVGCRQVEAMMHIGNRVFNRAQLMEILDTAQPKPEVGTLLQVIDIIRYSTFFSYCHLCT